MKSAGAYYFTNLIGVHVFDESDESSSFDHWFVPKTDLFFPTDADRKSAFLNALCKEEYEQILRRSSSKSPDKLSFE